MNLFNKRIANDWKMRWLTFSGQRFIKDHNLQKKQAFKADWQIISFSRQNWTVSLLCEIFTNVIQRILTPVIYYL